MVLHVNGGYQTDANSTTHSITTQLLTNKTIDIVLRKYMVPMEEAEKKIKMIF